ncbi:hypothetical protein [Sphingomonas sp. BK580]|uniref:hypothetical protein n=1 Tax=Sphingomonas sp. BK580 TaxID=2586972 RepID=UPI001620ED81|nr:hypothetical protein [Sphingomonas sp. BK580]MBB3693186.1 hypothetical protein [Sphingomonas sp. BK580]
MKRLGKSKWRHFPAYGGPEDGAIVMIPKVADWHVARRHEADGCEFDYVLVNVIRNELVVVPKRDDQLVSAYGSSLAGQSRSHDVLAAEVERRGLSF